MRSGAIAPACCASPGSSSIRRRRRTNLPLTDWILRQREIVIRDALIVWDDDLRNAPQLVLDRVQFRLENRFGRHRFGLQGHAAGRARGAARPARRSCSSTRCSDWQNARGHGSSCASTTPTSPRGASGCRCPEQIASGNGRAARLVRVRRRQEPREIIADVELADVKATLARRTCPRSSSRICRAASARADRPRSARSSRRRSRSRRGTASGSTRRISR